MFLLIMIEVILSYLGTYLLTSNYGYKKRELSLVLILMIVSSVLFYKIKTFTALLVLLGIVYIRGSSIKSYSISSIASIISYFILILVSFISDVFTQSIETYTIHWYIVRIPIYLLLSFISFRILARLKDKWLGRHDYIRLYKKEIVEVLTIGLVGVYTWIFYLVFLREKAQNNLLAVGLVLLFNTLIAVSVYVRVTLKSRKERNKELLKQYESLKLYSEIIEDNNLQIRKLKHDINNVYAALNYYADKENLQAIKKLLKEELAEEISALELSDFDLADLNKIKVDSLKAILLLKMSEAKQHDLSIEFGVEKEIRHLPMKDLDINRVFGNLLDNAIESARQVTVEPLVGVYVAKSFEDDEVKIVIYNTFLNSSSLTEKSENLYFTTKETGQGLGLHNVSEIIGKYEDITLETEKGTQYFIQRINIKQSK